MATKEQPAEVLIFGYGNPSRGDDALGPLLLERLEARLDASARRAAGGVELLTDFQLQVEHALDLRDRRLVLFVDAHAHCPTPWRLTPLAPAEDRSYSTHALSPGAVLKVYRDVVGAPPPCFLLGIRGERFELGDDLSAAARAGLDAAVDLVAELCADATVEHWLRRCDPAGPNTTV